MMIKKKTCISAKKLLQQIKNDSIKSPENKLTSLRVEFMRWVEFGPETSYIIPLVKMV